MEVVPQNTFERAFNVIVIITALVIFSSFVSCITNAMTHIRNINAAQVRRESEIRRYFCENSISHDLATRVWSFIRTNRIIQGKRLTSQDLPVLSQLPVKIQDDLKREVFLPILLQHPFFMQYNRLSP